MKRFLPIALVAFLSLSAFAEQDCPNLSGTFQCKAADRSYVVTQLEKLGAVQYSVTEDSPSFSKTYIYLADGQHYDTHPPSEHEYNQITCEKRHLVLRDDDPQYVADEETHFFIDHNSNLVRQHGVFKKSNPFKFSEEEICDRVAQPTGF